MTVPSFSAYDSAGKTTFACSSERLGHEVAEADDEVRVARARSPRRCGPGGCAAGRPGTGSRAERSPSLERSRDLGGAEAGARRRRPGRASGSAGSRPRAGRARSSRSGPRSGRSRRRTRRRAPRAVASSAATACLPRGPRETRSPQRITVGPLPPVSASAAARTAPAPVPARRGEVVHVAAAGDRRGQRAEHGLGWLRARSAATPPRSGRASSGGSWPPPRSGRCGARPCARAGRGSAPRRRARCRRSAPSPAKSMSDTRADRSGRASVRACSGSSRAAEPRVDVRGAEHVAHQELDEIALLVRGLAADERGGLLALPCRDPCAPRRARAPTTPAAARRRRARAAA